MLRTLILVGRSGSGKGTQAAFLRERLAREGGKILYVETGDRFRSFIREDTLSAKRAKEIQEAGGRQPDFLACWMWGNVLVEELHEDMHIIFDGAPRSREEAEILSTAFDFYKRENPTVIYINVGRRWSEERLLARGRSDDSVLAKVEKKLRWFDESVVPALEYFKEDKRYRFIEVNGEQSIEKVAQDIKETLGW